ncbi:PrpF domain-containing protein [Campylobacter canadensis]|uniref:PrpF domain-containing protein n=1 Tax=Campylobacter canadensis TaxID=449520 RepID=UPI001555B390|nr:PrpF domain-containing protein [Campylobacter canadensis]MBZ7995614.1 hypothetical protein [Campylobacter canadensis]
MENSILKANELEVSVYRGGTSRGLMCLRKQVENAAKRLNISLETVLKRLIDNENANSIDGLGGGISSTNKVCLIDFDDKSVDASWEFYQIGACSPTCSNDGTCGNIVAAVAAFVLDMKAKEPNSTILLYLKSKNINKIIQITLKSDKFGNFNPIGEYEIAGVKSHSSKISIDIKDIHPSLLTSGKIIVDGKNTYVEVIDCINIFTLVDAKELEIHANYNYERLNCADIFSRLVEVKENSTKLAKLAPSPVIPRVLALLNSDEADIEVRVLSAYNIHKSCPASAFFAIAAAIALPNSLAQKISAFKIKNGENIVKIKHLKGIVEVKVKVQNGVVVSVGINRSARMIMRGIARI